MDEKKQPFSKPKETEQPKPKASTLTTTQLTSMTRPMSAEETRAWIARLDAAKACEKIPDEAKKLIETYKRISGV